LFNVASIGLASAAVPYAISNIVLSVLGPIIVSVTYVG
jgi:hypothetical protein